MREVWQTRSPPKLSPHRPDSHWSSVSQGWAQRPGQGAVTQTAICAQTRPPPHSSFVSQKVTFLLDATLGMINIEQSNIIKIFSIAAGVFLPPTLIASIYGMNFAFMPELRWAYGYPFAAALMLASALLPFWYFKRRGWL